MSVLEMMYVYFDTAGEIKSISPELTELPEGQFVTTTLLSEVKDFLLGKKNISEYYIKNLGNGKHFALTKKVSQIVSQVRTLDNFLSEIHTMPRSKDAFVLIENFIIEKKIRISLGTIVKLLFDVGTDEDQEMINSFISQTQSCLFFTKKGDPYSLLHSIIFSPKELFSRDVIEFSHDIDLSDASVYTKRLLDRYSYRRINSEL